MTHRAVEIRFARETESAFVSSVLVEAATWVAERCAPIWPIEQLGADAIVADVVAQRYVLAIADTDAVGRRGLPVRLLNTGRVPCLARPPVVIRIPFPGGGLGPGRLGWF
jgi:hypothetical protein